MTALVDEHPHLGVEPVLRELNIPSSTYYRWRQAEKEPCERRRRDAELTGRIQQVHEHDAAGAQDAGGLGGLRGFSNKTMSYMVSWQLCWSWGSGGGD
ncbi:hypothetical protein OIC43_08930 [Streptomyces sp. NBC_00825]|uniref:hypothetical protein n=1 Tax=unclassified Streptomyces TaxID=2593676 RepID=UPI002ED5F3D1|nr:hypothetical protein OG832_34770 [Streptomyces sp. NBC_00826]WTH89161.1 hypothetical protein OIC43_08930 [Streptomyces sp. NBC_00825]WTH97885.1 hypothetical protein OHA23_08915 [Streptomyces sp. NBC_00822]